MGEAPDRQKDSTSTDDLVARFLRLLGSDRARMLVVRTTDRAASAGLIARVLDRRGREAQVVLYPSDSPPGPYIQSVSSTRSWTVLHASDFPGSAESSARSLAAARTVLLDRTSELMVRALWLPPSVLEGYARLGPAPSAVLVLDDWHALVRDYLAPGSSSPVESPDERELDRLLVDAFRSLSAAHLIVVTTQGSTILENAADAIFDVRARD